MTRNIISRDSARHGNTKYHPAGLARSLGPPVRAYISLLAATCSPFPRVKRADKLPATASLFFSLRRANQRRAASFRPIIDVGPNLIATSRLAAYSRRKSNPSRGEKKPDASLRASRRSFDEEEDVAPAIEETRVRVDGWHLWGGIKGLRSGRGFVIDRPARWRMIDRGWRAWMTE